MDNDVEKYIQQFDSQVQERLQAIRKIVHSSCPNAAESISYGLIGYAYNGKPLIYFGGFKHHIGLYATPNGHEAFANEFAKYKQGKGSVQFPLEEDLPVELIRRVVAYRVESLT